MTSFLSFHSLLLVSCLVGHVFADCRSIGTDFVNGGGPYCIDATSTDYFSFGTEFFGCTANDTQNGQVTPILIDPNSDEYFCSDIATNPDGHNMQSTCDIPGNVVTENQMSSGTWIVIVEGLTFAWMRSFSIIAGPPTTVTSTPTATFTVTSTPTATSTSTQVNTITSTLPAKTITIPATTITQTSTITPRPITVTSTSFVTFTHHVYAFSTTVKSVTMTPPCAAHPTDLIWDPICTVRPSKASFFAAAVATNTPSHADELSTYRRSTRSRFWARSAAAATPAANQCTTTVLATTNLPSTTLTTTAPTTTLVVPTYSTVTATLTPDPVTAHSGTASTTTTITKPTVTVTKSVFGGVLNQPVTTVIWATLTQVSWARPTC